MALRTAPIDMGNKTADRPFFFSANAVSVSCFSFISQCNCLMSKLLQEHSKGSLGKKNGSGYGYGTVPGGRWAIDTEGGHVVVSVSLINTTWL